MSISPRKGLTNLLKITRIPQASHFHYQGCALDPEPFRGQSLIATALLQCPVENLQLKLVYRAVKVNGAGQRQRERRNLSGRRASGAGIGQTEVSGV
jgi:hypothetical protein